MSLHIANHLVNLTELLRTKASERSRTRKSDALRLYSPSSLRSFVCSVREGTQQLSGRITKASI